MTKRADGLDIMLCEDKQCGLVHIVLYDENDEVFAEAAFEPTHEWEKDFTRVLGDVCRMLRARQKTATTSLVAH